MVVRRAARIPAVVLRPPPGVGRADPITDGTVQKQFCDGTSSASSPASASSSGSSSAPIDVPCDKRASPLIIDTAQDSLHARPVSLTSPEQGILFDILGANSTPAPYTPKKISWMRNHSYMFLALPDASGQVEVSMSFSGTTRWVRTGRILQTAITPWPSLTRTRTESSTPKTPCFRSSGSGRTR